MKKSLMASQPLNDAIRYKQIASTAEVKASPFTFLPVSEGKTRRLGTWYAYRALDVTSRQKASSQTRFNSAFEGILGSEAVASLIGLPVHAWEPRKATLMACFLFRLDCLKSQLCKSEDCDEGSFFDSTIPKTP